MSPRIAIIHALEESIAPARAAFRRAWPEAYCFDLLETSLAIDRAEAGRLDASMSDRLRTLADYAAATSGHGGQTAAILFTCSAFGPAIDAAKTASSIPVLRPNEAAFAEALKIGSRLLLVVTFGPSQASLEAELQAMAQSLNKTVTVETVLVEDALDALKANDGERHDSLAADAVAQRAEGFDAVILGQFSLARARSAVERVTVRPVITTPDSAAVEIRRLVESQAEARSAFR